MLEMLGLILVLWLLAGIGVVAIMRIAKAIISY